MSLIRGFAILIRNCGEIIGIEKSCSLTRGVSLYYYLLLLGAVIPPYIPENCTVRELLLHHLDIRALPKKVLLR